MTGQGRDLGTAARRSGTTLLVVSAVLYGVEARDPAGAGLFLILLLLPDGFPLYRYFRELHPTVASGLLGLTLLVPILDYNLLSHRFDMAFAHFAMLLAVWKERQPRRTGGDHAFLLGISVLLVVLACLGAGDALLVPLLAVWAVTGIVALVRLNLAREEQRVLVLARVRGFEWSTAEEVGGRENAARGATFGTLRQVSFFLIAGGFLLGWITPYAASGVAGAWNWLAGGKDEAELPEAGDGRPPFEIPPGVSGPRPFGARLDKREFQDRREATTLALILRSTSGGPPGRGLQLRGECYDYLGSGGRWIRSHPREREIGDAADGAPDGRVGRAALTGAVRDFEYALAPNGDRTLYAAVEPAEVLMPRVAIDGTGNLLAPGAAPPPTYRILSCRPPLPVDRETSGTDPELTLLPPGLSREDLVSLVREEILAERGPYRIAEAIASWMRANYVCMEGDPPPKEGEPAPEPAPETLDVRGFLFSRRTGGNLEFATAYAMLLRAVGIPCRLATGYEKGDWLPDAEFLAFRAYHVRAWVEVPFFRLGWAVFDPTPEAIDFLDAEVVKRILDSAPGDRAAQATAAIEEARRPSLLGEVFDWLDDLISSILPGGIGEAPVGKLLSWIIVLVGLGLLVRGALRAAEEGRGFLRRAREKSDRPPLTFYERLLRMLERYGLRRSPAQTPLEFARVVLDAWGPDYSDVQRITNAFMRHRYGEAPITPEKSRELMARVADLEAEVRRRADRQSPAPEPAGSVARVLVLLLIAVSPAFGQGASTKDLVEALGSDRQEERLYARGGLRERGREAVPALLDALTDPVIEDLAPRIARLVADLDHDDYERRERATAELIAIGRPAREALEALVPGGSPEARHRAARILATIRAPTPVEVETEKRKALLVRRQALPILAAADAPEVVPAIARAVLAHPELRIRGEAALVAIARRDPMALDRLLDAPDPEVRALAVLALARSGRPEATPRLLALAERPDDETARAARRALVTGPVVEDTDRARRLIAQLRRGEAETLLRRVLRTAPGYGEAGLLLAGLLEANGARQEAARLVEGLDLPEADRVLSIARLGPPGALAIPRVRALVVADPGDLRLVLLGVELLLSADPPRAREAVTWLNEAIRRNPFDARLQERLGFVYGRHLQDGPRARESYRRAAELDPVNAEKYRADAQRYR